MSVDFTPQLQHFPVLKQEFKLKGLTKKIVLPFIFHMPPMYLFWGLSTSRFRAGLFPTDFLQRMKNWFKLASAQPNRQPKKKVVI